MADIQLPGPALSGFAIRLLEDRPAYDQKKGDFLKMPVVPGDQLQKIQTLLIDFTRTPHRVFASETEANGVRDQLAAVLKIKTEVVYI